MENKIIKQVYESGAYQYEDVMKKYWHVPRETFIKSLDFKPGQRIIEAAVGTGLDLPYYPSNVKVIGIDLTQSMLDIAKQKRPETDLRVMDIHSLDFPDNYFDGAVLTFTLCVVEKPEEALKEILRVTKRGTKIAIIDYCKSKNPDIIKWQELINYHAANVGFPEDVIVWNSLMDYDNLIYDSNLPINVLIDNRIESENPFSTACKIILINKK